MRVRKVPLFGAMVGFFSLFFPLAVVKPNRIAAGEGVSLFALSEAAGGAVTGSAAAFLVAAALSLALGVSLVSPGRGGSYGYGVFGIFGILGMGIFLLLLDLLAGAQAVLASLPHGRLSTAAGFWLLLGAVFFFLESARGEEPRGAGSLGRGSLGRGGAGLFFSVMVKLGPFLAAALLLGGGFLDHLSVVREYANREGRFLEELSAHAALSSAAVGAAVVIGVPLGVAAWRRAGLERPVFALVNGIQTLPSLALFGLMIAPLAFLSHTFPFLRSWGIKGIGNAPALIALTLYSLLPVVRNTYTALAMIPEGVIDAGTGLGMSKGHLLRYVEIPLAVPVVLGGIRVSAVLTVGNTAVAALIGAGGLGNFVFQGLGQAAPDLIMMGVLPIILMAVLVDRGFGLLAAALSPPGFGGSGNDKEAG